MDGNVSVTIPYIYLSHVMVVSARVGAALLFAPIWGYPGIPGQIRLLLVFSTALGIAGITPISAQAYTNPVLVLPAEFFIGLLLSMSIRIVFAGLHLGGALISYHLGLSAVQSIDPQTANKSTVISGFLTMFGYVIILASDQHHGILRTLANSYGPFPVGTVLTTGQWFEALMTAAGQVFIIGWKVALPVFLVTFLIEIVVGFIARMQPQLNAMVVTAPLKLIIGIVALGASLTFLPGAIGNLMDTVLISRFTSSLLRPVFAHFSKVSLRLQSGRIRTCRPY
jgi:flagellar biosynthetic protein FliR